MNSDPTPFELVTNLHSSTPEARAVLKAWCGPPITKLIETVADRLGLERADPERLMHRGLRWLEMYLTHAIPLYQGLGRRTFLFSIMLAATRWLDPLDTNPSEALALSHCEPTFDTYEVRSYLRPLDPIGGDWWDHDADPGSALWIIVGDVTGHGYAAYLLAAGLPHLWRARAIAEIRAAKQDPLALLGALGCELEAVLPDDIFVEAVLGALLLRARQS